MGGRDARRLTRRAATGLVASAALVLAACTATTAGRPVAEPPTTSGGRTTTGSAGPPTTGTSPPQAADCRTTYAPPDPHRPRMSLDFTISPDHHTVEGDETIAFTPDLPITQLVFRLTANTEPTVAEGNRIVVQSATADHGARHYTFTRANAAASTQGGLLHIPFAHRIAAGTPVTAHIRFRLTLGTQSFDRFGTAGPYAYFGSGEPLLAWQRGFGWHTEDMIDFPAESATSEAMDVRLTVHAPAADTVIMSGDPQDPPKRAKGMRTWRSHIATARDVSVAAGPFAVTDTVVDGVRLRVGAPNTRVRDALVPEFVRAIRRLQDLYGPFPFPSLSVARVPAQGGGIEYPSSILMLDGTRLVAVHETAHQWFYAMVGDSQALHPWLDEAFAEYSENLIDHDAQKPAKMLSYAGDIDRSTESYGHEQQNYYFFTYYKGAAALETARKDGPPAAWDAALRCYVNDNAWTIATPRSFEKAIAGLPKSVAVLRTYGAIP